MSCFIDLNTGERSITINVDTIAAVRDMRGKHDNTLAIDECWVYVVGRKEPWRVDENYHEVMDAIEDELSGGALSTQKFINEMKNASMVSAGDSNNAFDEAVTPGDESDEPRNR